MCAIFPEQVALDDLVQNIAYVVCFEGIILPG